MISINGDSSIPQPQDLNEDYNQIQTDKQAIGGSTQRNRLGQKKFANMGYTMLAAADYQNLLAKFTTGSGIFYSNTASNKPGGVFAFSGLPTFQGGQYVPGSSLYTPLTVTITEQYMSQPTTTSGYLTNVAAAYRPVSFGVQVAWQRIVNPATNFFTIGTSLIGGGDFIKSGGSFVSFFDRFIYTDYSPYVLSWSVQRMIGQYPFGVFMAQADVIFDNTSNLFLPGRDATIGSGILPNRPIKISFAVLNESLNQFVGFTGQPEPSIQDRTLTVHAFDVIDYINKYSFTTSGTTTSGTSTTVSGYLVGVTASTAIQYYLTQMGFSANQMLIDQSLQTPTNNNYISVIDRAMGDVFSDLTIAEQAIMFADENGIINWQNRQHFLTTSGLGVKASFDYTNMVSLDYEATPIINDVIVNANPRTVQGTPGTTSTYQPIYNSNTVYTVLPGQSADIFASFTDDFGDLPVTAIDPPVDIAAASSYYSSYTADTAADGSGSDPASFTLTGVYLFGKSYKMTFVNSGTAPAYITNITLWGTPAKVTAPIQQRYLDQLSIDAYGRNPSNNGEPLTIANDYIQDSSQAYSLAYTLVAEYKTPGRRYKAEIFSRPELQIGDYCKVTVPDSGEVKYVFYVGTQTQMALGNLTHYVWLEERNPRSYFTIGTSTIQGTDQIAP